MWATEKMQFTYLHSSRHVQVEANGVKIADTQRPTLLFETRLPTRYYYLVWSGGLISLVGSIYSVSSLRVGFTVFGVLGLLFGTAGVTGLVVGCPMMVQETGLAVQGLRREAQHDAKN